MLGPGMNTCNDAQTSLGTTYLIEWPNLNSLTKQSIGSIYRGLEKVEEMEIFVILYQVKLKA